MNIIHRWLCRSAYWRRAVEQSLLPWALEGIDLGSDVLEIGPGPGLTTDWLRQRVTHLTALEIDPRLAGALKQRLRGTNVRVIEDDATKMPFEDRSFSAVISLTMLHHVPSSALQDKLLAEARRVLRHGGVFVGIDSTPSLRFRLIHIGDTMIVVDPDTFGARLRAAGFSDPTIDGRPDRFRFRAYAR
jgi:SAM-dependent methyltransferase